MKKVRFNELCEYKDEKFEIELEYYYNEKIDEYFVDKELGNVNLRKIRNKYREIKKLLTDEEIKTIREQYKLSQRDFAIALGFGEITITRYESKTVQDKAQDSIIKQSKNPQIFILYLEKNQEKFIQINGLEKYKETYSIALELANNIDFLMNQYSLNDRGNTEFKFNKLKSVINYIKKNRFSLTKTFLAKLLWYIDCLCYYKNNKSMTGLVYISMPYGAYPKMYDQILNDKDIHIQESWINDHECYFIDSINAEDLLTKEEKNIIEYIIKTFNKYNSKELVDYMHEEKAYKETQLFKIISYEYSNSISIYKDFI